MVTKLDRDVFESIVDDAGIEMSRIHTNYSGRGMYGSECVSLTVDSIQQAFSLFVELGAREEEIDKTLGTTVHELVGSSKWDNMGMGFVIYFPSYQLSVTHSCNKELRAAQRREEWLSNSRVKDGAKWKCSCGQIYTHVCDEAEGCYWDIT